MRAGSSPVSGTIVKKRSLKGRFFSVESRFESIQIVALIQDTVFQLERDIL